MPELKRLRDLPEIATLVADDEAVRERRRRALAGRPATVRAFEDMTPPEKDAALKALFLEHGLCT